MTTDSTANAGTRPRQIRDVRLQTRDARRQLAPRKEPYWKELRRGLQVGYYHADMRMTRRVYAHLLNVTIANTVKSKLRSFGHEKSNVRKLRP